MLGCAVDFSFCTDLDKVALVFSSSQYFLCSPGIGFTGPYSFSNIEEDLGERWPTTPTPQKHNTPSVVAQTPKAKAV